MRRWNGIPLANIPGAQFNFQMGGGTLRNPLAAYGEAMECPSRGGFLMQIDANPISPDGLSTMTAAVRLTVREPIFMTPFAQWGDQPGFYGIQTLNISYTMNANWWLRVWSSNFNKVGNNQVSSLRSLTRAL
jgi:hypothetical protein